MSDCGELLPNPSFENEAIGRLLSQFSCADNLHNFIRALMDPVQFYEACTLELGENANLKSAGGIYLDRIGSLYGVTRDERTDDDFRNYICALIACAYSDGSCDSMINVINVYLGEPGHVEVEVLENGPGFKLTVLPTAPQQYGFSTICQLIDGCRPAAIHWYAIDCRPGIDYFCFAADSSIPELGSLNGYDDGFGVGGCLVEACGTPQREHVRSCE